MRIVVWTWMALLAAAGTSAIIADSPVTVVVTVIAPATGPMNHLTAKDFVVAGRKADVAQAALATEPLSIELLVDVSRQPLSATSPMDDVHAALGAFVQAIRSVDPDARMAVMRVGGAAQPVVPFEAPDATLDHAVATIAPGPENSAVLIEAVDDASRALAKRLAPRRAIVSVDFASPDPIPNTAVNAIAKDVFESGATVWAVSARGTVHQPLIRENALNTIVKNNGGERITIIESTGLKEQLQTIANSLLSQYELTITGTDAKHIQELKISTAAGAKVLQTVFAR